jgi:hypothetical protein
MAAADRAGGGLMEPVLGGGKLISFIKYAFLATFYDEFVRIVYGKPIFWSWNTFSNEFNLYVYLLLGNFILFMNE